MCTELEWSDLVRSNFDANHAIIFVIGRLATVRRMGPFVNKLQVLEQSRVWYFSAPSLDRSDLIRGQHLRYLLDRYIPSYTPTLSTRIPGQIQSYRLTHLKTDTLDKPSSSLHIQIPNQIPYASLPGAMGETQVYRLPVLRLISVTVTPTSDNRAGAPS
jgi:hypothetical protein